MSHPEQIEKSQSDEEKLRKELAKRNGEYKCFFDPNEDIYDVPDYLGCFSKGLPHDLSGVPDPKEMDRMLDGIFNCWCNLDKIKYPGTLRLINPSAVHTQDLAGPYKACTPLPPSPRLGSSECAQEMIELYNMALLRDLPFNQYGVDPLALQVCRDLGRRPETLFRGHSRGDLIGPYVSQFLWLPYTHCSIQVDQKYSVYPPGIDYMKTWSDAWHCQNGVVKETLAPSSTRRYIMTLRDGASYVHVDDTIEAGLAAICILDRLKCPGPKFPLKEKPFIDLARTDLLDLMTTATRAALMSCWYHKWSICKVRPECVGMYVHQGIVEGAKGSLLHPDLLKNPVLNRIYERFGSYLLPQAYPEGCPCHPSYPAGHAVYSGAVTTLLKAWYQEDFLMDSFEPSADGSELLPTGQKLRVGDELDKMASNLSLFRNGAGIHFRSDARGIELGEKVVIGVLRDYVERYPYHVEFSFHKRDGSPIKISN